ncbi:glycosyltransferase [Desulfatitalea alkaliphila]|uniref:Glycosyltransferase n=1 Tax=Desulfatitalea alkaliphila TaxID=2929485 RepID=A0AA41R5B1_9BACT|nr:glycosyltransferase [Desulfatitalea alkaliphila]MCJ8502101.1 glycosyltransferase [Desulfatitalea alkaliphila]
MAIMGRGDHRDIAANATGRNLLMLCYYYPPLTDVGCRRSVAFSRYFKKYGWKPTVLSVSNPDPVFCRVGNDRPPEGVDVVYCRSWVNTYWFLGKLNGLLTRALRSFGIQLKRNPFYDLMNIPDLFWGWIPAATIKGCQLMRKQSIDLIYVSCTPFSSAVAGVLLKKLTGKPLVIDFRDPFALEIPPFPLNDVPSYRRYINRTLETWLLRHTDVFVVTPDEIRQRYIQQYPWIHDKICTIYNGIEPADIRVDEREDFPKFTVVYGGNFYFDYIKSDVFFQALAHLQAAGNITADNFQFLYYGGDGKRIKDKAKEYAIEDLVIVNGMIPYQKMLNILAGADLQLLRIVEANMGTKIFDGLALNVPLLATIPEGEPSDIVRKYSPDSYLVGTREPEKVADAILDAMNKREGGQRKERRSNTEFFKVFSREATARQLMEIIEQQLYMMHDTQCAPTSGFQTKNTDDELRN